MRRILESMKKLRGKARGVDWNPPEHRARAAFQDGSIMQMVETNIATIQKENTIKHAADEMMAKKSRRVFVTEPDGTLIGVVTAKDIVNFLGGGEKYNLVKEKHNGNLTAAINEPVREVMSEKVVSISSHESINGALRILLERGIGGAPVLKDGKVVGIVTEKEFTKLVSHHFATKKVKDFMTSNVIFGSSGMPLADIAKVMVRNGFRRIPVLRDGELVGVVTSTDLVKQLSKQFSQDMLETRIDELMKASPITTAPDTRVVDAAMMMRENNLGGLPVLEGKKMVGMLTQRDLLKVIEDKKHSYK